jgi:TolA-binding protein
MAFDNVCRGLMAAPLLRLARVLPLALLVALAGCSSGPKKPPVGTPEPDKFLFDRGTEELNARHWLTAREYFRQLVDSYPQSRYRADAKLGVGDTYIGEGSPESFVLAANEFREFLTFYPTHTRADYAQLKLGMTFFYQMHGPERDQTETREAMRAIVSASRSTGSATSTGAPSGTRARSTASRPSLPPIRSSPAAMPSTSTSPTRWSGSSGRRRHSPSTRS